MAVLRFQFGKMVNTMGVDIEKGDEFGAECTF